MSINFDFFIMLLFTTLSVVVLSVCIGVGGCLCHRNSRACRAGMASLQSKQRARILASAVDDMTALIICEIVRMAPLLLGFVSLLDMNKCPPALLRALVSDK